MGAAALDPAPSAGMCMDGSDLVLQSFARAIDSALICRSIRIRGRLSTFRYVPAEFRVSFSAF